MKTYTTRLVAIEAAVAQHRVDVDKRRVDLDELQVDRDELQVEHNAHNLDNIDVGAGPVNTAAAAVQQQTVDTSTENFIRNPENESVSRRVYEPKMSKSGANKLAKSGANKLANKLAT